MSRGKVRYTDQVHVCFEKHQKEQVKEYAEKKGLKINQVVRDATLKYVVENS